MCASLLTSTISAKSACGLHRWFSAFLPARPTDDDEQAALMNWIAETREMRSRASLQAEGPPLPSY
jgi:hypothetical protein